MKYDIRPLHDNILVKPEKRNLSLLLAVELQENFNQGTVVAIGKDVKELKVGDVIKYGNGTYLNYDFAIANHWESEDGGWQLMQEADVCAKVVKPDHTGFRYSALRDLLIVKRIEIKEINDIAVEFSKKFHDASYDTRTRKGEILSVGKKVAGVEVGDFVYFMEGQPLLYHLDENNISRDEFLVIREQDILVFS